MNLALRGTLTATLAVAVTPFGCGGEKSVKVPDVTGTRVLDAQRVLSDAGLSSRLDSKPAFPTRCEVADQSARGMVAPDTEVTLRVRCPRRLTEGED